MNEGAFAFIDCLGWKGIWEGKGKDFPQLLFNKLSQIEDFINNELIGRKESDSSSEEVYLALDQSLMIDANLQFEIRFLSDTVIIGVRFAEFDSSIDKNVQRAHLIDILSIILTKVVSFFINDEPHLPMRGCISYGDFYVQRNHILGQAVDWAAEGEKIPKGAFIFLHESAESIFEPWYRTVINVGAGAINREEKMLMMKGDRLIKYKMPVKDGKNLERYILNPLANHKSEVKRQEIIKKFDKSMNKNNPEVQLKRENTLKFLELCEETSDTFFQALQVLNNRT